MNPNHDKKKIHQGWAVSQVFYGPKPSKIDTLVFTWRDMSVSCMPENLQDLRLFSTGGGNQLSEWDIHLGVIKRSLLSQGGSIWSMAANPSSKYLAIGCEDGCVRLVTLEDDDFRLLRKFDRVKSRILSIAWGPPRKTGHTRSRTQMGESDEDEDDSWEDYWLVTGCSDSSLRKWDVKSGRVLDKMTVDRTRSERTLVWAVGVLADGTIVSGDSMGMVKFWDKSTSTLLQSFTPHGADVLCLAIGSSNDSVYTSGVDQRITEFFSVEVSTGKPSALSSSRQRRWIQSCTRRLHSHDVRCLGIWPPPFLVSNNMGSAVSAKMPPILISGGMDMSLIFSPCATPSLNSLKPQNPFSKGGSTTFQDSLYHRASFSTPSVCFSPQNRFVVCRNDDRVLVWRIQQTISEPEEGGEEDSLGSWTKLLDMQLKVKSNLTACCISLDGLWLAVADIEEVKLFRLQMVNHTVEVKRVKKFSTALVAALPAGSSSGASSLLFSPDSRRLIVATAQNGFLVVIDIEEHSEPRALRVFNHHRQLNARIRSEQSPLQGDTLMEVDYEGEQRQTSDGEIDISIRQLAVSPDGQWLASSDLKGRTLIFNLDSLQHHCTLPTMPLPVAAMAFESLASRHLLFAMPDNSIHIFDVESRLFPQWQRRLSQTVSRKIGGQRDTILGVTFAPQPQSRRKSDAGAFETVIAWGANWICRFRIYHSGTSSAHSSKRRRDDEDGNGTDEEELAEEDTAREEEDIEDGAKPLGYKTLHLNVFTRFRNLLGVQFLNPEEMVVVEKPLLDVLSKLPPAYFKARYGT
ncbi:WD40 repeat-like protein [Serendipita vermifera]|nr:WD40 repeat-like protein [Serendipita vermifera]